MTLQSHLQIKPQTRTRTRTRRLSACYRHPAEPVTGFCALCLRERLAGLEPSGPTEPSSSTTGGAAGSSSSINRNKTGLTSSLSPELRRSKSVSVSRCEASSGSSEPRRKSCDVKVRSTLSNLFNLDDGEKGSSGDLKVESKNLKLSRISEPPVFEAREEEDDIGEEIRVSEAVLVPHLDVEEEVEEEELKTMKEHIDLELLQSRKDTLKDLRDIAGSLASVFTKKLQKWRQKQVKKRSTGNDRGRDLLTMRINGLIGREMRDTQLEIGEYGLGRRSCDTEPRFSVDAGRMSVDGSRFSFDEPRASWDGYLIARTIPRLTPMLSVVEDAMLATANKSIEEDQMNIINEDESTSGGSGSGHTNSDSSSSQRRSSFDRSSSVRSCNKRTLGIEGDEQKCAMNANVSPAKLVITEKELKDWRLSTLKDDHSQRLEPVRKNVTPVPTGSTPNRVIKASGWRKACKKWGFVPKFSDNKHQDFALNGIENPVAEASEVEGVEKGTSTVKFSRSSSCVGSRNSFMESNAKSVVTETSGSVMKGREEFALERNKSTGYSPSDNGLLRFYLTPFRSYRRSKSGKSRPQESHSLSRNALRLN